MAQKKISDKPEDVFAYDPTTGHILKDGSVVGYTHNNGYLYVSQGRGRKHLAHRLAWYLYYGQWPTGNIDHKDRDKSNNKIDNLRDVSQTQNLLNHGNPFSGIYKHRNKWRVRVGRGNEAGSFYCFGEALKTRNKMMKDVCNESKSV